MYENLSDDEIKRSYRSNFDIGHAKESVAKSALHVVGFLVLAGGLLYVISEGLSSVGWAVLVPVLGGGIVTYHWHRESKSRQWHQEEASRLRQEMNRRGL